MMERFYGFKADKTRVAEPSSVGFHPDPHLQKNRIRVDRHEKPDQDLTLEKQPDLDPI